MPTFTTAKQNSSKKKKKNTKKAKSEIGTEANEDESTSSTTPIPEMEGN
jgi:hypothetical protein